MAIQPIDLQVLFSRLDQVGKEQAAQKDGQIHQQAVHGAEIARKAEQQDHSVNQTQEVEKDGVTQVKEEKKRRNPGRKDGEENPKDEEKGEPEKEILREPHLGKNIDITG